MFKAELLSIFTYPVLYPEAGIEKLHAVVGVARRLHQLTPPLTTTVTIEETDWRKHQLVFERVVCSWLGNMEQEPQVRFHGLALFEVKKCADINLRGTNLFWREQSLEVAAVRSCCVASSILSQGIPTTHTWILGLSFFLNTFVARSTVDCTNLALY